MATTLTTSPAFNPFFCNGKEVSFIEFTQNGQPIGTIFRGWFGVSNNYYKELVLPFEVKNKRVYSNKVEPFLIKVTEHYSTGYKLVLPVEMLQGFKLAKKVRGYKSETETQYADRIYFTAMANKLEPVKTDPGEVVWKRTGLKPHEIVCEVNFTYEKTDIGIIREKISEAAKSVGVNLTSYDIKRLQEVFNISLK